MSVYVDPLLNHGISTASTPRCFRNTPSCHMYADTLEELHEMSHRIGLKREWFQDNRALQHYDLVASRRERAVALGAVEQSIREAVRKWRELRELRRVE